jgi:2-pyrone-4,6-dicarboxylate lactonase
MPDDGKLLEYVPRIAPTPALRQKLLVENPARLYFAR